ncbi:MAG: methyl-accepting chemotaxis protein [Gallionellaceae bacterium]|jgi:methyl-accepting chemotaxis protein
MKNLRFTIRYQITLLALAGLLFLVLVGGLGYQAVRSLSAQAGKSVAQASNTTDLLNSMRTAHGSFLSQLKEFKNIVLRGADAERFAAHMELFEQQHTLLVDSLSETRLAAEAVGFEGVAAIDQLQKDSDVLFKKYNDALKYFNSASASSGLDVDRRVRGLDEPIIEAFDTLGEDITQFAITNSKEAQVGLQNSASSTEIRTLLALALSLPILLALSFYITRHIVRNLNLFQSTIAQISAGDYSARVNIKTNDELGVLSRAFNELLDSRVATLANAEKENNELNESVLSLLHAVAQLSRRDLTAKAPVSENVTGAVADAINLMAGETAKVMAEVNNISADVTKASMSVQTQADNMLTAAEQDREEVDRTANALQTAAQSMRSIANLAQECNSVADSAIKSTQLALNTVNSTVSGINSTRDVIRETEKRIKRLGDRSQEISGVVNLINVIAERTHILALNASMHAASAGEAGRGFAVVADEVQRLAENARQATQQISALVSNIQLETADTVSTMNSAIAQIVEGSRLAEQAGQQMQLTQQTTADLVASVKQIAVTSETQAAAGQDLMTRSEHIRQSSEKATAQLHEQASQTSNLMEYAKQLLAAVRVFKLPA